MRPENHERPVLNKGKVKMKKSNSSLKIAAASVLAFVAAGTAHAFESTAAVVLSPIYIVAGLIDTTVFVPSATTVNLSQEDVASVKGAQADAVSVAQGGQTTDTFNSAKQTLEKAAKVTFPSNEKAALAILDVGSQL
jgi:hypothetical protein